MESQEVGLLKLKALINFWKSLKTPSGVFLFLLFIWFFCDAKIEENYKKRIKKEI